MARVAFASCLLAALCCAAVAAAADPKLMVPDILVASKATKARTASSYYDNTELACMNQLNFKNCRYTGCPVDRAFQECPAIDDSVATENDQADCRQCAPDSIYFQTDLTCCKKEHSYYYGDNDHHDIGLAFNDKVGTCDWEISMYRVAAMLGNSAQITPEVEPNIEPGPEVDPWHPHATDDGTAVKWGTAWGTCYLNAEAEHCGSPLCERMAISIQGGLYATCAYSTDNSTSPAQFRDNCGAPPADDFTPDPPLDEAGFDFNEFGLAEVLQILHTKSAALLADVCFGPGPGARRLQSTKATTAKTDDYYSKPHTYYPGIALVLSGPMYVTAKKDKKLEDTGMLEQVISFKQPFSIPAITEVVQHWPIVSPRSTKVRFTRDQEEYYQGASK